MDPSGRGPAWTGGPLGLGGPLELGGPTQAWVPFGLTYLSKDSKVEIT